MDDPRLRLLAVSLIGLLPWSLVATRGAITLFHPLGFLNLTPPRNVVYIWDYLFVYTRGLPEYILSLPIGGIIYLFALVSATLGLAGLEDRRLTAGLLVLVGLTQLSFVWGFGRRSGYVAVPIATITTFTLVWWVYWPDVKRTLLTAGK